MMKLIPNIKWNFEMIIDKYIPFPIHEVYDYDQRETWFCPKC
jgi:hypothetical protein